MEKINSVLVYKRNPVSLAPRYFGKLSKFELKSSVRINENYKVSL